MKRLVTSLLLIPLLSACQSTRPPTPSDSATATYDITTGRLLASTTYGGSKAGQAQDTGSSKVAEALAGKVDAGSEFAYVNLTRYAEDQPDVAIEQRLANNEKGAATQLAAAVSGGAPSAVIAGIQNVLTTAIKERADYEKAKANRPKPDTAGISITSFMNGPGSHAATAIMGAKFGDTLAAKTRSNYVLNNETTRTDTSNTNDYSGVSNVLRHQLELAKIDLEMAKIKAASVTPAKPPVVKPVEPKPADPDEPSVPEIPGQSPEARHKSLYPHVKLTGGNAGTATNHTLWKPGADQGADGLVIVTQHNLPKIRSLAILKGGTVVKRMGIDDVVTAGNGYRLNWRFGGRGYSGAHTVVADTVDGQYSVEIPDGNKRNDGLQMKKTGATSPTTSSLFILEADKLTLRPDFAAAVRTIDVLTKINDPNVKGATNSVPSSVRVDAGPLGPYTWGIPKPLSSYPRGNMPNTWRIGLIPGKIPADVTYHTSIMQTFIQDGATKTYPPTTRE